MNARLSVAASRFGPAGSAAGGLIAGQSGAAILIALWIALLLISFAREPIGSSAVYQGKFLIALPLSAWFLLHLPRSKSTSGDTAVPSLNVPFAIWMFVAILSIFATQHPLSGLALISTYLLLFVLTFHILPSYLNSDAAHRWYTSVFFWSVIAVLAVLVVLARGDALEFVNHEGRIRYAGFFRHPNFVGYFFFLASAISIRMWLFTGRRLFLLTIPIAAFIVFEASSRTALAVILLLPATLLVVSSLASVKSALRSALPVVVWTGAMIVSVGVLLGLLRLPSVSQLNELISSRIARWSEAVNEALYVSIWLGQGLGREGLGSVSVDSFFASTLVQSGMLGLLALVLFLVAALWAIKPPSSMPAGRAGWAAVFPFCLLASLVVYSVFENVLFSLGNPLSLYVWSEVGLALRRREASSDAAAEHGKQPLQLGEGAWRETPVAPVLAAGASNGALHDSNA